MRLPLLCAISFLLVPHLALSQSASTEAVNQPLPESAGILAQVVSTVAGNNPVQDVTLAGTAMLPSGVSGTIVLKARGAAYSRVDVMAGNDTRIEVRGRTQGRPAGWWQKNLSAPTAMALHNCFSEAAWFFPLFAIQDAQRGTDVGVASLTTEQQDASSVVHLKVFRPRSAQSQRALAAMQRLSSTDVYIDSQTLLPRALKYHVHPDNDSTTNIAAEVRFADYRVVSGVQVPFRIQKLMNGTLVLDVVVGSAAVNTGVPLSAFTVN